MTRPGQHRNARAAGPRRGEDPPERRRRRTRVLVADEDAGERVALADLAKKAGASVHVARSPYDVVEEALAFRPDLVIMPARFSTSGIACQVILEHLAMHMPRVRTLVTHASATAEDPYPASRPLTWGATDTMRRGSIRDSQTMGDRIEAVLRN